MRLLRRINVPNVVFEFLVIFVCFLSLYYPLKDLQPYKHEFNKLHDNYIYTLNKNYDALFNNGEKIAKYHYEYDEKITLYMNKAGAELGAPVLAEAPFLAFYTFEISNPSSLTQNQRYNVHKDKILETTEFKSKYGQVTLDIDYLVVDEGIAEKYECEYKIYPSSNDYRILDSIDLSDSFSARGSTMKSAVFTSRNTIGIILVLIAIVPTVALMIALSFYYSIRIDRESKQIFIDNIFYKRKKTIVLTMFTKYFLKAFLEIIISGVVNYFIFIGNDPSLLFIPIILFLVIEAIYLLTFVYKRISDVLKEGVDIRYVN